MSCYTLGPFSQTLFLGCSVRNFGMNLAWGADSSSCNVGLIQDTSYTIGSAGTESFETHLESISVRTKDTDTASQAFNADNLDSRDDTKSLFRGMAKHLNDKHSANQRAPKIVKDATFAADTNWYYPDLGFIADYGIDIIGCPVNFRFESMSFGGLVKNWTSNSQGLIEVEIQSFANLLKNSTMILQGFNGSVSSLIPNTETFGKEYIFGQEIEYNVAVPSLEFLNFNGTIYQGNSPNVINVFGYLESFGLGKSGWTRELGIPAASVYEALEYLLGSSFRNQGNYSPYGALVAKSPFNRVNGQMIHTPAATLDNGSDSLTFVQLGMMPTVYAVDNLPRSLLRLDLSNIPKPMNGAYINNDSMTIMDFIDYCCDLAGVDYTIGFNSYSVSSNYSCEISFTVADRKKQNNLDAIKKFISATEASDKIIDYKLGEEYNESKTKSILIGGPQKRLHQMTTANYGTYRHRRIFEPSKVSVRSEIFNINLPSFTNPWAEIYMHTNNNMHLEPDTLSTRAFDSSFGNPWSAYENSVVAQSRNNFWSIAPGIKWGNDPISGKGNGSYGSINRGNYLSPFNPRAGESFDLTDEMIAPYFGIDNNNDVRTIGWESHSRQFYVNIAAADLKDFFLGASGYYSVSETELRYALGGFDSWWLYTSYRSLYGTRTPLGGLIYDTVANEISVYAADQTFNAGYNVQQKIFQALHEKYTEDYGGTPDKAEMTDVGIYYFYNNNIEKRIRLLHNFIATLAAMHYGKTYMVRLPTFSSYTDDGGRVVWSHSIADAAWEESNNPLDDLMLVGGGGSFLYTDDGRIKPFFGFNSSDERGRSASLTKGVGEIIGDYRPMNIAGPQNTIYYSSLPTYPNIIVAPVQDRSLYFAHGGSIEPSRCSKTYVLSNPLVLDNTVEENSNIVWHNNIPRAVYQTGPAFINSDVGLNPMNFEINALLSSRNGGGDPLISINSFILLGGLADPGVQVSPRAALPVFAAVPITHNFEPYGPWASHPGMIANDIFSSYAPANVNNLIGGTSVEIDEGMVPWAYGGMAALDLAGMARVGSQDKYEQVLEYGTLTVADLIFNNLGLGSRFENGPYITSINTTIGDEGIRTTYNFRTYSRKIGLYNKEVIDAIRYASKLRTELNRKSRMRAGGL